MKITNKGLNEGTRLSKLNLKCDALPFCVNSGGFLLNPMILLAENSAKTRMQDYVVASEPVIRYINVLFLSRELGIDW